MEISPSGNLLLPSFTAGELHPLELARGQVTLVITDMQAIFAGVCKTPDLIPNVVLQVELAIENGWAIVLLEVKPWAYGRTADPILKLLEGKYKHFSARRKEGDDGSSEVLAACRDLGFPDKFFRVTGVLTNACVSRTAWGLVLQNEQCLVRVIKEACATTTAADEAWQRFETGPRLVVSSQVIDK
jgi:nicotinamidase-related amidase